MAQWSKNKLNPSNVNNGNEYAIGNSAVSITDFNGLVKGVLYADDNSDTALEIANTLDESITQANQGIAVAQQAATNSANSANEALIAAQRAQEAAEQAAETGGTFTYVGGTFAPRLDFSSNPQTQIDTKISINGGTINGDLYLQGSSLHLRRPYAEGIYARGLVIRNFDGSQEEGGLSILGVGNNPPEQYAFGKKGNLSWYDPEFGFVLDYKNDAIVRCNGLYENNARVYNPNNPQTTAVTKPQNDNSTNIATTEYVRQAISDVKNIIEASVEVVILTSSGGAVTVNYNKVRRQVNFVYGIITFGLVVPSREYGTHIIGYVPENFRPKIKTRGTSRVYGVTRITSSGGTTSSNIYVDVDGAITWEVSTSGDSYIQLNEIQFAYEITL